MPQPHPPEERPFSIEHRQRETEASHFVPETRLVISASLRTSRFLAHLTDEQARTLLALLTFLTSSGSIQASSRDIADALALPERQAKRRLMRLTYRLWQGEPIAYYLPRETSASIFLPVRTLFNQTVDPPPKQAEPNYMVSPRAAIIAASRERYTRPRAEVEQLVAAQLGHAPVGDETPEATAKRLLRGLGVPISLIDKLLAAYPSARILQQIAWLPERRAKTPARFIVAAIKRDFAPPFSLKERAHLGAEGGDNV